MANKQPELTIYKMTQYLKYDMYFNFSSHVLMNKIMWDKDGTEMNSLKIFKWDSYRYKAREKPNKHAYIYIF